MEEFPNKKKQVHVGACTCAQQIDLNNVYQEQNSWDPKNMNTPTPTVSSSCYAIGQHFQPSHSLGLTESITWELPPHEYIVQAR
jgi:hypothetical protein